MEGGEENQDISTSLCASGSCYISSLALPPSQQAQLGSSSSLCPAAQG